MTQIPNQTLLNMEFFKRINIWEIQKTSERAEKNKAIQNMSQNSGSKMNVKS